MSDQARGGPSGSGGSRGRGPGPDVGPPNPAPGNPGPDGWSRSEWRRSERHFHRRYASGGRFGPGGPFGPNGPFSPGGHWDRRRGRPGWWPADEPWPPTAEFPWHKVRRRFILRFAIGVSIIFTLVFLGPIVLLGQLLSVTGLPSPASEILALAIVVLLFSAVARTARGARRFAVPFGDLIEATGKVEAGDYSARVAVPDRGLREMRWLGEAFNAMAARLEVDEQQRRNLLADVSHELRTPLAVLRGELEAMIDGVHPIDEAHLSASVDQIAMLTKLVEDLRTLALAEGGTLPLHLEPTDLAILTGEAAASFEGMAAAEGVEIRVAMPDDMPLMDLDPLRIREVVVNLLANALRYAPRGSAVSVAGELRPGIVTVSVSDAGPGIAPEVLPHLFERFARSSDSHGTGLGLAIARRLVEAHRGSIRAESPVGGGTRISFDLPTAPL